MAKRGKGYRQASEKIDREKLFDPTEAETTPALLFKNSRCTIQTFTQILLILGVTQGCVIDNRPVVEDEFVRSESERETAPGDVPNRPNETVERCENEDDLFGDTPSRLPLGFQRSDLYLCPDQTDVFELAAAPGEERLIKLTANPIGNSLDLVVRATDGEVLYEGRDVGGNQSTLVRFTQTGSTVQIEISASPGVESRYALGIISGCVSDRDCAPQERCSVEIGQCQVQPDAQCGADDYEPNNREDDAYPLSDLPTRVSGALCAEDIDWLEFSVTRAAVVEILVRAPDGLGLDISVLRGSDGRPISRVTASVSATNQRLLLSNLEEGIYRLGLQPTASVDSVARDRTYEVEFFIRTGGCSSNLDCITPGLPICESGACVEALLSGQLGDPCGRNADCAGDADLCYQGGLGGQDNVCTVYCDSDAVCSVLGADAYCKLIAEDESVCAPACQSDAQCGAFEACVQARCEVTDRCRTDRDCDADRVCRSARSGRRYCARPKPPSVCGDDANYEPNDRFSNATQLPLNQTVSNLQLCNVDDDYFALVLPTSNAPYTLTVAAIFSEGVDIDIYVYDAQGNILGAGTSFDQTTETVVVPYLPGGQMFLRVDQFDSNQLGDSAYSVVTTLASDGERCDPGSLDCFETRRTTCDERTGSCGNIEGQGRLPLAEFCDSDDDCNEDADLCPPILNAYCTVYCEDDFDCRDVGSTACEFVGQGLRICL